MWIYWVSQSLVRFSKLLLKIELNFLIDPIFLQNRLEKSIFIPLHVLYIKL